MLLTPKTIPILNSVAERYCQGGIELSERHIFEALRREEQPETMARTCPLTRISTATLPDTLADVIHGLRNESAALYLCRIMFVPECEWASLSNRNAYIPKGDDIFFPSNPDTLDAMRARYSLPVNKSEIRRRVWAVFYEFQYWQKHLAIKDLMYRQDPTMHMLMSAVFEKLPINMPALCERTLMCSAVEKRMIFSKLGTMGSVMRERNMIDLFSQFPPLPGEPPLEHLRRWLSRYM